MDTIELFSNGRRAPKWFGEGVDFLSDEDVARFTSTAIASGTVSVVDTETGGWLAFTGSGAGDGRSLQDDACHHFFTAGKNMEYMVKVKSGTMTTDKVIAGFALVDTTLYASPPNEWVVFRLDADGNLDCSYRTGGAEVVAKTAVKALANSTVYDLKIECGINAAGTKFLANFFCNGDVVGQIESTTIPSGRVYKSLEVLNSAAVTTFMADLIGSRQVR